MESDENFKEAPSLEFSFIVGLLQLELRIPLCHSLKAKRGILARVTTPLRKHFPISLSEVAHHDDWDRAGFAAVMVSGESAVAERTFASMVEMLEQSREIELVRYSVEML